MSLMFLFMVLSAMGAETEAITADGRKVVLHDDGRWEFHKNAHSAPPKAPGPNAAGNFRGVAWGTSRKAVVSAVGEPDLEQSGLLGYNTEVAGFPAIAGFIFVSDKLVRGKYVFTQPHSNKTDFLTDYGSLQEGLSSKYGKPDKDKTYWSNDLYQDDYSEWGMAVSVGHLSKFTTWQTATEDINLAITGDNYSITLSAEYASKAHKAMADEVSKKTLTDGL
jgi:hypothetical protein